MRVTVLGLRPRRHTLTEAQARTVQAMSPRGWLTPTTIGVRGRMIARPYEQLGELMDLGVVEMSRTTSQVGVIATRYRLRWQAIRTES